MFTTSLAIIDRVFDAGRRAAAIGAWGVVNGAGGAVGPLVGGATTSWWSWRGFFVIASLLSLVALPIIAVLTPSDERAVGSDGAAEPVPWARLVLVGAALVAFIVGVQSWGSGSSVVPLVLGLLLASASAGGAIVLGRRAHAGHRPPLLQPEVTRAPWFRPASVVGFCANWGFGVTIVFVGIELQSVRGLEPLVAGLVFSVFSVSCALAGLAIGPFTRWLGAGKGLAVAMASTILALAAGAFLQVSTPLVIMVIGLAIGGFGQGLAFDVSTLASLEDVPPAAAAEASGVLSVVRSMGSTLGVALTSSLAVARAAPDRGVSLALGLAAVVAIVGTVIVAVQVRTSASHR
jgi:MFS family permease